MKGRRTMVKRKTKPTKLGCTLNVLHLPSLIEPPEGLSGTGTDREKFYLDGSIDSGTGYRENKITDENDCLYSFKVAPMAGDCIIEIEIRNGVYAAEATRIIRKIADMLDQHGEKLLTMRMGNSGKIRAEGEFELNMSTNEADYDNNDDLTTPEIS